MISPIFNSSLYIPPCYECTPAQEVAYYGTILVIQLTIVILLSRKLKGGIKISLIGALVFCYGIAIMLSSHNPRIGTDISFFGLALEPIGIFRYFQTRGRIEEPHVRRQQRINPFVILEIVFIAIAILALIITQNAAAIFILVLPLSFRYGGAVYERLETFGIGGRVDRDEELRAIGWLKKFSMFTIAALWSLYAALIILGEAIYNHYFTALTVIELYLLVAVGFALLIAASLEIYSSFGYLSISDQKMFGWPTRGALTLPFFLTMSLLGALLAINGSPYVFLTTPVTPTPPAVVDFFIGLVFLGIGGISGMIVFIVGIVLGLRRIGEKYRSPLVRAASLILVLPFLNLASPPIIYIEANKIEGKSTSVPA